MWAITFLGVCLLPTLTSLFKTCIACINLFLAVLRLRCRMAFPVNAGSGGCSPGAVPASLCPGFSRFGAQSPGRVAAVMWHAGLGVMWDVGSSRTRDQTVTAAMAGRFLSTGPPGKSSLSWTAQPCISLSLSASHYVAKKRTQKSSESFPPTLSSVSPAESPFVHSRWGPPSKHSQCPAPVDYPNPWPLGSGHPICS